MKLQDLLPYLPTYQKKYCGHEKGELASNIFINTKSNKSFQFKIPTQYLNCNVLSIDIHGTTYRRWHLHITIENPIEICYDKETGGNE